MTKPRMGVYICHCGFNIAATVDVARVTEWAAQQPGIAIARHYTYMCSEPGQNLIKQDCAALGLQQVVVAACSPRMHEATFRQAAQAGGVNPYRVEIANIREQCAWVHADRTAATDKARALAAAAIAKAAGLEALPERTVPVTPGVVIIGGGIAGLCAALDVAEAGLPAYLVEQDAHLGGRLADLHRTFPELELVADWLPALVARVQAHPRITIFYQTHLAQVTGFVGNFEISLKGPRDTIVRAGAIIVATGYDVFDPRRKPELGYGLYPQVITTLELEKYLAADDWQAPTKVVFIKCVGSRDASVGNPYCSRVCCMVTAKQARLIKERWPAARVTVFYMDVRAFEEFYDEARQAGVLYRRGNVAEIYRQGNQLIVRGEDTLARRTIEQPADLVVLAVGMTARHESGGLAALKLPRSADGFLLEAHPKLRPVDTAIEGVLLAGCCQGPKDISDTIAQAHAAAASALIPALRGVVPVEAATAVVDPDLCAGCGLCAHVCPYGAPNLWMGISEVNAVLCKGCGTCAAVCPNKAIQLHHFTPAQILAQVDALVW